MSYITKTVTPLFLILLLAQVLPAQEPIKWRDRGSNKSATFYEVQQDFYNDWQGKTPKKGQGYKVFKRWENYMAPRVYPSGDMRLPSMAYENFMKWQQESAANKNASLPCNDWALIGPNVIPTGWDVASGRLNAVRFHPTDPNTMYVTSPDGGLWKTTNGGVSWTTNTDFLPVIGCSDLVIDPTNPQTMYLATGDWADRRSIGILKSTNGGGTWSPTGLAWTALDNYKIRRLLMHPTNPQVMMAATDGGIFRTTDGWATYSQACCGSTQLYDMKFKPGDPNVVYACGQDVWRSDDGGDTWATVTAGLPDAADVSRMMMAVTPANPSYVYIIAGNEEGGYLGTYRSTDSGTSFTEQSTTPNILGYEQVNPSGNAGQAGHDLTILVSPTDADLVTIGGISVFQSADGGTNWNCVAFWAGFDPDYNQGEGPAEYVHADLQDLQYLPGSSTTLFACSDGGIYKSVNNGGNWAKLSGNLSIAQQTSIAVSATSPYTLVMGEQDIGTVKYDGATWTGLGDGDGEDAFIHRENNNIFVHSGNDGAHAISFDGGANNAPILGLPPHGQWFSPVLQDPVVASTVYIGGRPSLYRKTDLFTNNDGAWEELGPPPGTGNVQRFEVAPSDNSVIYAMKESAVSRSTDAGATWTNITGTLPVADASWTDIAVSSTDANKAWVTFSGYSDGNKVFKTADGGASWSNISAGLPNLPINAIVYVNGSPNDALYIGADIGVYYLNNDANSWSLYNTGLPNNMVTDLEIYYPDSKLRVATYGRGAWESSICDLLPPLDNDGDGYIASNDCNDNNPNINPGAAEVCNSTDDNCNGQTDEGVLLTFYADADGDGFGNPASSQLACSVPTNYVADNTDCNDANASVFPGATEVCNSIDDNCDGQSDEGLLITFYEDADGDGFGNADVQTQGCTVPNGYSANDTDCNDGDTAIFPGATEVPSNGIDEDCDGMDLISGVAESWLERQLQVTPNPFSSALKLTCNCTANINFSLFDQLGRRLRNGSMQLNYGSVEIETIGLTPGVYLLRITDEAGTASFVKRMVNIQ